MAIRGRRKLVQKNGFLNQQELIERARQQGIVINPRSLVAAFRRGAIRADQIEGSSSFKSYLVAEHRVPEILYRAPRSRQTVPGFLRPEELVLEGKKRGLNLSLEGIKRKIRKGKLLTDAQEVGYHGGSLFRSDRLEELLQIASRETPPIPSGFQTTYQLLQKARAINPRIHLSHIQQFLARSRQNPLHQTHWIQAYSEKYGKKSRLIFPISLGTIFLEMVRKNELTGLFARHGRRTGKPTTQRKPKAQPRFPSTTKASPRPARKAPPRPQVPSWYQQIGNARFKFGVAQVYLKRTLPQNEQTISEGKLAEMLGFGPHQMQRMINQGLLEEIRPGQLSMASIKRLFGI